MSTASRGLSLGREVDQENGGTTDDAFLYDPNDLTAHGVGVGITGSGTVRLCIDVVGEAAA